MDKQDILELVLSSGLDDTDMFGGRYTGGKYIQQVPEEIAECLNHLIRSGKAFEYYAEIGAAGGGVAYLINKVLKPKMTYIVDNDSHPKYIYIDLKH